MTNIHEATDSYEEWLKRQMPDGTAIDAAAIEFKHGAMKESPFPFLRATFYRWAERWVAEAGDLANGPTVLAVGDLHVENFGSWCDASEHLIWGINDFDEAAPLPWTSDLVRLGASAALAVEEEKVGITLDDLCGLLLEGYEHGMSDEAAGPIDLTEEPGRLQKLVEKAYKTEEEFWGDFAEDKRWEPAEKIVAEADAALAEVSPKGAVVSDRREQRAPYDKKLRKPSGLGSLGRSRYCVVMKLADGRSELREAKVMAPSAVFWAANKATAELLAPQLVESARRRRDPNYAIVGGWAARRVAPDAVKIAFKKLKKQGVEREDIQTLFRSMGYETANVHVGSSKNGEILADLRQRSEQDASWFVRAVEEWCVRVMVDWEAFSAA